MWSLSGGHRGQCHDDGNTRRIVTAGACQGCQVRDGCQDYLRGFEYSARGFCWEGVPTWRPSSTWTLFPPQLRYSKHCAPPSPARTTPRPKLKEIVSVISRSGQHDRANRSRRPKCQGMLPTRIAVGWTMCRVRARTLPPERCFRCQNFGHNARSCTGPDRTGACWKCGLTDHLLKDCKAPEDRCLACELAGHPKTAHRPGSGACAARRLAVVAKPAQ